MEAVLSVAEFAELRGCGVRYVQSLASQGKINAEFTMNSRNRKIYQFPISSLPADLQQKYYAKRATEDMEIVPAAEPTPFDRFSADEREEIAYWMRLIEEWKEYRAITSGSKAEVDEKFVLLCQLRDPDHAISVNILYRRWKALREQDYKALVDMRGKVRKGKSKISSLALDAWLFYYLDPHQYPLSQCYNYTIDYLREYYPQELPIPHLTTFMRHTKTDVPMGVKVLGRDGEKAYDDRIGPYMKRFYDDVHSNQYWIADNHTFDVIVQREDGSRYRPYLTAFLDARSGIFTGYLITDAPSSESTLAALRKGILKYGIPDNIYVDNGREFLTADVGGLGHRKKKPKDSGEKDYLPPPIFERLGIKMTNALVRNARAKTIERRFLDIKNQLSRLFTTYTGGNVVEKPECLKSYLKNGEVPLEKDFKETVETLLEWEFNMQPYSGSVVRDIGKPRMQIYNEQMQNYHVNRATEEDLHLMMLRSSRPRKIGRNGLMLNISGHNLIYYDEAISNSLWFGKYVYYRYDPDDLSYIRVYDLKDRFIMTLPLNDNLMTSYGVSAEKIKNGMHIIRRAKRNAKELLQNSVTAHSKEATALVMVMARANAKKEANEIPLAEPKVINIRRPNEQSHPYRMVVGGGTVDMALMARNASRNIKANGGEDYDEDL